MVLRVVVAQPPSTATTSTAVISRRMHPRVLRDAARWSSSSPGRPASARWPRRRACRPRAAGSSADAGEGRRLVAEIERPAVAHAAAALGHRDTGAGRLDVQPHTLARLEREPGPPMVGAVQVGAVRDAREVGTAPGLECEGTVFEVEFADRPIRPGPTFEAALSADCREHADESSPAAGLTWSVIHYILYQTCMLLNRRSDLLKERPHWVS